MNEIGTGTLVLSGPNTFSGPITVGTGAVLSVASDGNLGAVPAAFTPADIVLASGGTLRTTGTFALNANRGIALGPGTAVIDVASGTTLSYNGIISNNGGAGGFSKLSFGSMTLGGANTYTGPTNIQNGTVTLDFTQATAPASNIINSSSALSMGGANAGLGNTSNSQLLMSGKASTTNTQTFNGTTFKVGPSVIRVNSGASGTATLNLGAITQVPGGIANFILPTSGAITTTTGNTNGILGGWATVGTGAATSGVIQGPDFASVDANGHIVTYTGYTPFTSGTVASNNFPASANLQNTTGANLTLATGPGTVDINSLELNNVVNNQAISDGGATIRFGATGGILVNTNNTVTMELGGTGVGAGNQDIGTITAGGAPNTPGTLVVTVNSNDESSGAFRIGAVLADNGSGPLTFVKKPALVISKSMATTRSPAEAICCKAACR